MYIFFKYMSLAYIFKFSIDANKPKCHWVELKITIILPLTHLLKM